VRRISILFLVAIFIVSMVLVGTGCKSEGVKEVAKEEGVEEVAEEEVAKESEEKEEEAKPFEGQTITVAVQSGVIGDMLMKYGPEWEEKTGGKVLFGDVGDAVYYSKLMLEFQSHSGAYDITNLRAMWYGDVIDGGYIIPLDDYIAQQEEKEPGWYDQYFINDIESSWGGKIYGIDSDGDNLSLFYRKDLFNNEEEKAAFKDKYGYELSPDMTWDQYLDIAEFFTRDAGETLAGEVLEKPFYGTIDLCAKWGISWWLLNRFAAMDGPNPRLFDINTMEPRINSEAGVKALENFVKSMEYAPPGTIGYEYMEFAGAFLNGDVAMLIMWPDIGRWGSNPETCSIIGKIGYAPSPGKLIDGKIVHRCLLAASTAWTINADSKYKDAAWDFIVWWNSPENIMRVVTNTEGGIDPYEAFQIEDPIWDEMIVDADEYLSNHMNSFKIGWQDLRISGAEAMYEKLATNIGKALMKELTPEEALDLTAEEWNTMIDDLGRDRLKEQYINSIAHEGAHSLE